MSEIQPYNSLLPSVRTSRTMARISSSTTTGIAMIHAKAELEAAKADGFSAVAAKALTNVALLSQMEQSLAQTVPHASGRLAVIADLTAMALADVVTTAARRIGH